MAIVALCFWSVQPCIIQVLNDQNTLILQSIVQSMVEKIRGYNSIIIVKHA